MNDYHKKKAAELFGVPVDQVTDEQRRAAKARNFFDLYTGPFEGAVTGRFSHDKPNFEEVERVSPTGRLTRLDPEPQRLPSGQRRVVQGASYLRQVRAAEVSMAELEKRLLAEGYVRGIHDEWIKK